MNSVKTAVFEADAEAPKPMTAGARMHPDRHEILKRGVVIPATPLALDGNRHLNERHQRALYRYYHAAGAGGVAVGVHSTQFEIREPGFGLFEPLLTIASETVDEAVKESGRPMVKIGGVCGSLQQAVKEAELIASLDYDAALLSLSDLKTASQSAWLEHCRAIAEILPIIGFYLQPAVGGRILPYSFWRKFLEIENVAAIKVAPFDRYKTVDVARAVAMSGRVDEVPLYTGNDDNIIADLLTPYIFPAGQGEVTVRIKGGLLGQWAIWTQKAVEILNEIHAIVDSGQTVPFEMLQKNAALTDASAAVFDAAHNFAGCIPGINEVLRRQGLMTHSHCLHPIRRLSPGQAEELDRINRDYPWLIDDDFVRDHLDEWLS